MLGCGVSEIVLSRGRRVILNLVFKHFSNTRDVLIPPSFLDSYDCKSDFADKYVGQNARVTLSTCSGNITNFDTQISVYTGSCNALQCLTENDDAKCGLSSTALFIGKQNVTYYVRVHGLIQEKGDFGLTVLVSPWRLVTRWSLTCFTIPSLRLSVNARKVTKTLS
jgi:hypothetical protein